MESYYRKLKYKERVEIQNAYLSAYWQRVKKMPSLKDVLKDNDKQNMSDENMLEVVKQLNKLFGGEVVNGRS